MGRSRRRQLPEVPLAALPLTSHRPRDGARRRFENGPAANPQEKNVAVLGRHRDHRVTEPGAVFGEISALLDCPHTAEVLPAPSEFHVAHPAALQDPAAPLRSGNPVRRLDGANQALVERKVD
jgi:hypothetical protein